MDQENLWQLFHATGDPMAYVWYKVVDQKEEPPKPAQETKG